MTRKDWQRINEAMALLECEIEDRADNGERGARLRLRGIRETWVKVHEELRAAR